MVLVKFVAFLVFEIWCSLILVWSSLNANNFGAGNISKTVQCKLMFIFDELSEFVVVLCHT